MKSVEVSFEKSEATDYVLEILSLGICSLFFPMSFVPVSYTHLIRRLKDCF